MDNFLSIITVCKNEPFIESTCISVCEQSCQNFEWIIVDGASDDDTLAKAEPYKNRANVFISEPDNGIYEAMNKGIKHAKGDYCLFLNGGDLLYNKDTVARVIPYLKEKRADVFYGDSYRLFEEKDKCFIKTYPDTLDKSFFLTNTLGHQSSFIRRELFEKYGGYREDFKIVSDKEKWLCFMENHVVFRHLPFVCSQFRMNGISQIKSESLKREKKAMLLQYYPEDVVLSVLNASAQSYNPVSLNLQMLVKNSRNSRR